MKEIVHAIYNRERQFERSGKPVRTAMVGECYCTGEPLVLARPHRWQVETNGKIPPTHFSENYEEVTCPKCMEWVRARQVVAHVQDQKPTIWDLYGRYLDMYAEAVGATRAPGETDTQFRTRIVRIVR